MDEVQWITAGLKKHGKTGKGLADALGVEPSAISRIKGRQRRLHINELPKAAAYLEVPVPPEVIEGLRRESNAAATPAGQPEPSTPPAPGAPATTDIPSTGNPHTQAPTETPELRIVREVAGMTLRRVWDWFDEDKGPTEDEFFALVRSVIADYEARQVRARRRNLVDSQTQTEAANRKDDKASERE